MFGRISLGWTTGGSARALACGCQRPRWKHRRAEMGSTRASNPTAGGGCAPHGWNHSVWETVFGATPKTATGTSRSPAKTQWVGVRHGGRLQRPGQRQFGLDEQGNGRLNFQPQMKHRRNTDFSKPVRAGIYVASPDTNGQSSVRSDISGNGAGICRPRRG